MHQRNESPDPPGRQRCYRCFRPVSTCFCEAIPSIHNRTHVLILQHVKERFHAFNTARIVRHALQHSTLIVDQTPKLAARQLPFAGNTGVLYPDPEARLLSEIPASEKPEQIVIIDGTWHHAKTFMNQIPALQKLPRFRLEPDTPGNYRIRKEPNETALSTLEATVAALRMLEPDTIGLQQLLDAFDHMVDTQIQHPQVTARLRRPRRPWQPPANIPSALLQDLNHIVVAYGESTHGPSEQKSRDPRPVYWTAQRLISGETFECAIDFGGLPSAEFLSHLKLTNSDFENALTPDQFRRAWKNYLRPADTLVVFNAGTARLLKTINADWLPVVLLKSVNIQRNCRTLDDVLSALNLTPPETNAKGRAGKRLANAIAYTHYLHELGRRTR